MAGEQDPAPRVINTAPTDLPRAYAWIAGILAILSLLIVLLQRGAQGPTLLPELNEAQQAEQIAGRLPDDSIGIPTFSLETRVEDKQIDLDGVMPLPKNLDQVARYESGARFDGDDGAVVLVGRIDSNGAFSQLRHVQNGALIVTKGFEPARIWKVAKLEIYDGKRGLPDEIFRGSTGARTLYLIGTTRTFNRNRNASDVVVVTARPD